MSEAIGEPIPEARERGDLADPKKVGRKALLDRLQTREEDQDTLFVLSTVPGRRFYWRLLKKCRIFESSFTGNNTTFFNEGERNIGLILLNKLNAIAPHAYLQMMEEAKHEAAKTAS